MAADFALIETMRVEQGRAPLLDLHRDRLRASAAVFGFPFDATGFDAAISAAMPEGSGLCRLRLTFDAGGRYETAVSPFADDPDLYTPVTFAEERVDPDDLIFRHKTTRRAVYERAYEAALAAGFGEAILLNRRGEVTEGTRTNVFARIGGRLLTPPLQCGLLGGVFRRLLLTGRSDTAEAVLYPDDLRAAEAVYLCNAVRGMLRVRLLRRAPGSSRP